ncbi:MAG: methyltransferase domain-containing protein [Actinomycetota bacterium]
MRMPEHALAHRYLDGLDGIEIGGAAHNSFGLDTLNVDAWAPGTSVRSKYDQAQIELCGEALPIDVVAAGHRLPFRDDAWEFVITSHVIEHFPDPIGALHEWARVASSYVFIICPQRDALESDRSLPLTPVRELVERHRRPATTTSATDEHHTRFTSSTFRRMCEIAGYQVVEIEDPDQKVGNGFAVVLDVSLPRWKVTTNTYRRRSAQAVRHVRHLAARRLAASAAPT